MNNQKKLYIYTNKYIYIYKQIYIWIYTNKYIYIYIHTHIYLSCAPPFQRNFPAIRIHDWVDSGTDAKTCPRFVRFTEAPFDVFCFVFFGTAILKTCGFVCVGCCFFFLNFELLFLEKRCGTLKNWVDFLQRLDHFTSIWIWVCQKFLET